MSHLLFAEAKPPLAFSVAGTGNVKNLIQEAFLLNLEIHSPEKVAPFSKNIHTVNWPEVVPGTWVMGEMPGIQIPFLISYKEAPKPIRTEMWLSNTPEKVNAKGLLKTFHLGGFNRHQLMYHHHNTHHKDLYFQIYLKNTSTLEATIYLNRALGGPSTDEIFTGDISMKRFWQNKLAATYYSVTLPAGQAVQIVSQKVKPANVVSGLLELIPEDSNPSVGVFILTSEQSEIDTTPFPYHEPDQRVDGVFEIYQTKIKHLFLSKDPSLKVRLGEIPVIKNSKGEILKGNYGMEYHMTLDVQNIATQNRQLQANFIPAGGIAAATFLLNGQMVSVAPTKARQKKEFLKLSLEPGEKKEILIRFIPQAGANYPIDLEFNWL